MDQRKEDSNRAGIDRDGLVRDAVEEGLEAEIFVRGVGPVMVALPLSLNAPKRPECSGLVRG
jgi:hypothetical protein